MRHALDVIATVEIHFHVSFFFQDICSIINRCFFKYNFMMVFISVCSPHYYGSECNTPCGQCRGDDLCENMTGHCPNGCKQHWTSIRCDSKQFATRRIKQTLMRITNMKMFEYVLNIWIVFFNKKSFLQTIKNIFERKKARGPNRIPDK